VKTYLLSVAMLLLAVSPGRADLIENGGFENFIIAGTDQNFGGFVRYFSPPANTDIAGWTISGTSGGNPNSVDLVNNTGYPPFEGKQSLDMEGAVGASGVIFQSFATTPGDVYDLTFEYANNPFGAGGTMNVLVTGTGTLLNQDVSHNGSTGFNMNYKLFSADFTADSAKTTLQFAATTNSGFGVELDAVSVNSAGPPAGVPEPTLVGPLGAGLVALLFATRRRRYLGL
jgi:hypothetical protein